MEYIIKQGEYKVAKVGNAYAVIKNGYVKKITYNFYQAKAYINDALHIDDYWNALPQFDTGELKWDEKSQCMKVVYPLSKRTRKKKGGKANAD